MTRPTLLLTAILLLTAANTSATAATAANTAANRPNFVFLVSEDNSIHYLRLYGARHGSTPHIDALARHGLVFNHAFSCSPVCSVARSTLATGIYAPRGGFQYHRKIRPAPLPAGLLPWSAVLKENGYYTTNRRKTDYNFQFPISRLWHASSQRASWRNRPNKQTPFFHMQSFGQSHESSLHFPKRLLQTPTTVSPQAVQLAPYHPDTPTFRYTHARYFDRMGVIDQQIGRVVSQLEADGLLEDTFIFYFGDHGGVLPRSKGYAYESGLHVPLVVRIPNNFKHLVDHKPASRLDGFVSFIDFGPTVLHLAGLTADRRLDGRAFLGPDVSASQLAQRDEALGHADRFDEKYDHVRTLRKGRFAYVRNYQGYYPDGLQNNYRYRMLAFAQWRRLHLAGKLSDKQRLFFEARPAEQLFDLESDPHQVNNLAAEDGHRRTLLDLRDRLRKQLMAINDLSVYPESFQVSTILANPIAFGRKHSAEISRLLQIADLSLLPADQAVPRLRKHLASPSHWDRYWACQATAMLGPPAKPLLGAIEALLEDKHPIVRLRAAECLGVLGEGEPIPVLYQVVNSVETEAEELLALNTLVYLRDHRKLAVDPARLMPRLTGGQVARRLEYLRTSPRR